MRAALADLARMSGTEVLRLPAVPGPSPAESWGIASLAGRLVELCGGRSPAQLTAACGLVVETQLTGDRAAWITLTSSSFFAPDVAAGGVDIEALPVVRVPDLRGIARAADYLVRSNGFGLVVLDLAEASVRRVTLPVPVWTRLAGLARAHDTAVLILTRKSREALSLNSLISLRAEASLVRDETRCDIAIDVLKDKRGGPGWHHLEACRGSVGLR